MNFWLGKFRRDERGSIMILFAMLSVIMIGVVGGAVDYGRWLSARSKTHNAMDTAVLAGGRVLQLPGTSTTDAENAATKYYNENKSDALYTDNTTFSVTDTEIVATTASTVKTPFLNIMGIPTLPVNVVAKAVLSVGGNSGSDVEVSMMLDTTGSMGGSKIADLKTAAKDLIDIVVWQDQSEHTSKIAIAPFSYYVNVGTTYFNAITGATASGYTNQRTCVKERSTSDRYTDAPPSSGNYFNYYSSSWGTCKPTSTVMPLSNDVNALKTHIDNLPATGMTAGHLGTAWAWYLISPNWASVWPAASQPQAYSKTTELNEDGEPKLHKIAILMTDGSYNQYYSGSSSTTQARAICENMKTAGVTVYTVGFAISVGSTPDVTMQLCATSSEHYYNASNGEALKQAFRDIALKISDLRLSE